MEKDAGRRSPAAVACATGWGPLRSNASIPEGRIPCSVSRRSASFTRRFRWLRWLLPSWRSCATRRSAAGVRRGQLFGAASANVERVSYSATVFFHLIPGITETSTRLPPGAPLVASPEAPELAAAGRVLLVLFVIRAVLQVRHFRSKRPATGALNIARP